MGPFSVDDPKALPPGSDALIQWLANNAAGRNPSMTDIAIQLLASLLRVNASRQPFYSSREGMKALIHGIKRNLGNAQVQYQCCFCLWLLTFNTGVASKLDRDYDVIPLLLSVAKAAVKEKIIRVIIATFRNMVEKAMDANIGSLLSHRVLPFVETLSARKWGDEEIPQDLEVLQEALKENLETLR
ncbi:ATPase, V1 complex, subunit H [Piptocephalis cylindrospora]|uniref:ATPase, V1 complex, subunit H n=1 Tax=Piptocephalis cylindrospora TaxID=1907219 RepID=A0A4P9Y8P4_9FUNG|nr:ATPase, V1 complex, subunit H [Piptocephalis cylindrospora]|eukprot:RKP15174.1 ATPase, V1 complex, subunit H [Piptocephalis cylindrospora]